MKRLIILIIISFTFYTCNHATEKKGNTKQQIQPRLNPVLKEIIREFIKEYNITANKRIDLAMSLIDYDKAIYFKLIERNSDSGSLSEKGDLMSIYVDSNVVYLSCPHLSSVFESTYIDQGLCRLVDGKEVWDIIIQGDSVGIANSRKINLIHWRRINNN